MSIYYICIGKREVLHRCGVVFFCNTYIIESVLMIDEEISYNIGNRVEIILINILDSWVIICLSICNIKL